MTDTSKRIEQLRAEEAAIVKRQAARDKAAKFDRERQHHIWAEVRKLELSALVGIQNAVKLRCRFPSGDRCSHLNDQLGTLAEIRRTRCAVVFGGERWDLRLDDIGPLNVQQGFRI